MLAVQFRPATEEDYPGICNLITNEEELGLVYPRGNYPFTIEQVINLAQIRRELTVATIGPTIVGFANLYDYEPRKTAFIGNVVVDKAFRRKGIGRDIIAYMLDLAFGKHHLYEVNISVFTHNIPALLLYARFGFAPYEFEERNSFKDQRVVMIHMTLLNSANQKRTNSLEEYNHSTSLQRDRQTYTGPNH